MKVSGYYSNKLYCTSVKLLILSKETITNALHLSLITSILETQGFM